MHEKKVWPKNEWDKAFNRGIELLRFNDSIGFDSVQPAESYHLTGYGDCFANINCNKHIYTKAQAECCAGYFAHPSRK